MTKLCCPRNGRGAFLRLASLVLIANMGLCVAQVAGPSVNMVTGTKWPGGDPFLERQNEPSMAVSSRNSLHLLAGGNDYRTVDLPGLPTGEPTGDAWLGLFTSMDGGGVWQSNLVPGYPQDNSSDGIKSPLKGYNAGADPSVRAGTNGLLYYSGLVFNRDTDKSAVFLARYVDDNNLQGGNTIRYLGESLVAVAAPGFFLDKPALAVDIPRPGSPVCQIPIPGSASASVAAGRVYVAYTQFIGDESSKVSDIYLTYSNDCGVSWVTPKKVSALAQTNQGVSLAIDGKTGNVYVVWRIFKQNLIPDSLAGAAFEYRTSSLFPVFAWPILPFDQGTTGTSFRTNAYPSVAVDNQGIVYIAWSQRGSLPNSSTGNDARIQVLTGEPVLLSNGDVLALVPRGPFAVDLQSGRGHQVMPALAVTAAKLTVAWYDFRDDDEVAVYTATAPGQYGFTYVIPQGIVPQFASFIADPAPPFASSIWRHTVDVRAARAPVSKTPQFQPSIMVSQYTIGTPSPGGVNIPLPNNPDNIEQLEFNPPNLPLFQHGTVPFFGDYIDVAGPTFIATAQGWRFNNLPGDPDVTHIVWTDNRNVVQPMDNDWTNFTPVGSTGQPSVFDPSQTVPLCKPGQTGMRNQDIYTASFSSGLILTSKGGFKQLTSSFQREFPVTVQNTSSTAVSFRLTIVSQPTGGSASFLQYPATSSASPLLTQLVVSVPPLSSASRSVFITSSDPTASVPVNAVQVDLTNTVVPGGLSSLTTLNSDVSNPNISNPNISNVEVYNPNISNPNISNPNISNLNISNPNISNPNISNVSFANPNISNPNISNPNISNPNISNPNISNPNISNAAISGEITDASYTITNSGNTSSSYALNLVQNQPVPQGVTVQLIVSGVYLTPVANACSLAEQAHFLPIVNITQPKFLNPSATLPAGLPDPGAPTFSLDPGEKAIITFRVYDTTANTPAAALLHYNPIQAITPLVTSQAINTNLPPPPAQVKLLAIATTSLPAVAVNAVYNLPLQATGGHAPYTWTVSDGSLPSGITLQNGVLLGSSSAPGAYRVTIQVSDASGQTVAQQFTFVVSQAVSIASASIPNGSFETPYQFQLTGTGGTPPYNWSLVQGTVLPAGISFDTSTGLLSGTPVQAGVWSLPVTVTDSASPVTSSSVTIPFTVGLATAYAGAQSCLTPYPATPLYPNYGWSLNDSSLAIHGQLSVQNNNLTGCLAGNSTSQYTSGTYSLAFVSDSGGFTLSLPVVAQDVIDNGLFHISSAGIGLVPPNGVPQGVVTSGQSFPVFSGGSIPYGADAPNFSGTYLFGLSGVPGVQDCRTTTNGSLSLTAPSAGRFDILFTGTNQTCSLLSALPASPAPITFLSVDSLQSPAMFAGTTISNVTVSYSQSKQFGNVIEISQPSTGATIPVTVNFGYSIDQTGCVGTTCIAQIQVGLASEGVPQSCVYSGVPLVTGTSASATATLQIPNYPGRYYISADKSLDFSCLQTVQSWWSGPPTPARYIAVVDVLRP